MKVRKNHPKDDPGMKGLAFVKDPDGYLIEILPQGPMITKPVDCDGVPVDGGDGYKDNSK